MKLFPHCQIEDLATPYLRGEAELRGEGRDLRRRGGRSKQRAELIGSQARVFGDATHCHRIDRSVARDDEACLTIRHDNVAALPGDAVAESLEDADGGPFSDGGSLIVGRDKRGVALLFAGSDQGGANGQGLTYANPLRAVLDALKADLAL